MPDPPDAPEVGSDFGPTPRSRQPLLSPGTMVDHFRVMRAIGRGGMGEVYLARDTKLGRRAALKIVRTEFTGEAEAARAFLFEAKTTAKFSHPNIVTVYDVGEYEGRPYVALEYLEGQNLDDRIGERRPGLAEAMRVGVAVASALAEAHRNGVLHLDLKPANIVIPPDGRLRVVDFGLARITPWAARVGGGGDEAAADDANGAIGGWGTPAYVAPEQWRRTELTAATDIWALGVILFEVCAGRLPYEQRHVMDKGKAICSPDPAPRLDDVADVPPELTDLVARCLDKDPRRRPTADEVLEQLEELRHIGRKGTSVEQSPFRGLMPFSERHADAFFGRDAEVAAFVERIRHQAVLPVVGPVGAGKSSFVQAGVIPRLREQGNWIVLRLRPGTRPFETLVDRLRRRDPAPSPSTSSSDELPGEAVASPAESGHFSMLPRIDDEDTERLAARLRESPHQLALWLRSIAEERGKNVLLVVEQLEEVFTLVDDDVTRRRFMTALCTAADDPLEPVRVVFTARDDYLGRLAMGPQAREALAHLTVIQSLDRTSLQQVLVKPVEALGYRYEDPQLVREMTDAVRDEPGSLPLLQFAAQRLWEQRDAKRRLLLRRAYEAMGGVEGALAQHADSVLEAFSEAELRGARDLLVRLVTPAKTRRVVPVAKVVEGLGTAADDVLDRLVRARLVGIIRARDEAGPRVELAHESLIRSWETLARWLDEDRDELAFLADVGQAAELWERRGRRPEELWQGDALRDALRMLERLTTDPPRVVQEFLDEAQGRQVARAHRRRLLLASAIASLLIVATAAVAAAFMIADREQQAKDERDRAQQQRAEALREAAVAAASQGDVLEARAKLRVALAARDSPSARALWRRLRTDPRLWHKPLGSLVYDVAFAPDGGSIAVGAQDSAVYVLDTVTRSTRVFRGSDDQVYAVAYTPDGSLLAAGSWSGTVVVWDATTGRSRLILGGHAAGVQSVAFSPDGRWLASGSVDESVRLWDVQTGTPGPVLETGAGVWDVAFAPNGTMLAIADDEGVSTWRVDQDRRELLSRKVDGAKALAWSPDGSLLAGGGPDGKVRIWTMERRMLRHELAGHTAGVHGLAFMPAGDAVVSASYDKTVRVWDVVHGREARSLQAHDAGVTSVAVDPSGHRLATTGRDRTVRLWDLDRSQQAEPRSGHTAGVYRVGFTPDGKTLVSGGGDRAVHLWDVETGLLRRTLSGHTAGVDSVAISPDGELIASGSVDLTVRLWNAVSGAEMGVLTGHGERVSEIAFSPDGRRLASASRDGVIRIWNVRSGAKLATLDAHETGVYGVDFSPDGLWLASGSTDKTVRLWSTATWDVVRTFREHTAGVNGVRFSDSGRWIASGGIDKTLRLWDPITGASRALGPHGGRVYWVAFDPTETYVGAPTSDGTATLWHLGTEAAVVLRGHRDEVNSIAFSPDGGLAATAADDGTVRLWDVATGRAHWRAPVLLDTDPPRLYTHRGWDGFDDANGSAPPADSPWSGAVEKQTRIGSHSRSSSTLCLGGHDDRVALWDTATGRAVAEHEAAGLSQLRAWAGGCAVLAADGAWVLDRNGTTRRYEVDGEAVAIDAVTDHVVVAGDTAVAVFDAEGNEVRRIAAGLGITAVAEVGDEIVAGYRDGNLELVATPDSDAGAPPSFASTPATAVERIVAGPPDTVIVGYADGTLGMWSILSGVLLADARLHGRVVHLLLRDDTLFAATDLGHELRWDLSTFSAPYCDVLHEVWAAIPVVWADGRVVVESPPAHHRCTGGGPAPG